MRYFKIVVDGNVIGAGCNFTCWNPNRRSFVYCDIDQAECARDVVSETNYHDSWLRNVPDGATGTVLPGTIILIDQGEYDDLIEQLIDGETVPEPEPEPEPQPQPEPEPESEPEHRMTVQEMREKIAEQEGTIEMLTECLLEMSEVVYGG